MSTATVLALLLTTFYAFLLLSAQATLPDQTVTEDVDDIIDGYQNVTGDAILTSLMEASGLLAREFLVAHNKVRMQFNEPPLQWDRDLARYARRWGDKRTADCKMIHTYGPHGENLFWGGRDHWTATEAVDSWASERDYYNLETNECQPNQMCGHYTQIIWKDSLRLGCARVKCDTGGLLVICEYDPPGNYIDEGPLGTQG